MNTEKIAFNKVAKIKEKVELGRSQKIISEANSIMSKSEKIQDKVDSKIERFEKMFDEMIIEGRELKSSIGELSQGERLIKKEMQELESILKELEAPTSSSKEYGLLENALKGLSDYLSLANKLNDKLNKYY